MLENLLTHYPIFDRRFDFNQEELTPIELVGRAVQKLNEVITFVNGFDSRINAKLSPDGNLVGSVGGHSVSQVLADINNSLSLAQTIINMINARESIGTIYDGGAFLDTQPPVISIEGGLF